MFRKFLKVREPSDKDSYHRDTIKKVAIQFLKRNTYTVVKELGSGGFGDVLAIKKKSEDRIIAAKIMHKDKTRPGEIYLWPLLKHPNVLPLWKRICHKSVDIFIMPYQPLTLMSALELPEFRENPDLFKITIGWLKGVMTGLEYMHEYGVCHLDLKPDNILITSHKEAVICDMSGLSETKRLVNTYVLPKCYRPPETWSTVNGARPYVDGRKFDVWSAGLLMFYCFSDRWIESEIDDLQDWFKDLYPLIFQCLKPYFFNFLMKQAHPSCNIDREDCSLALNLLQGVLRYRPEYRPTATKILEHPLFSGKGCDAGLLQPDIMWSEKITSLEDNNQSLTKKLEEDVSKNLPVLKEVTVPDVNPSDDQGTKNMSDVKEKKKRKKICQRIREAFSNLCSCFRRKKSG